jgi:hypothetical protein
MQDDPRRQRYLPDALVRQRYGVSDMTIQRWDADPELGFPKALRINGRRYRDEAELEAWERSLAAKGKASKTEAA